MKTYWFLSALVLAMLTISWTFIPEKAGLKVTKATAQNWAGGAAGSGKGTNYLISLTKKAKKPLKISSVWVGTAQEGKPLEFTLTTLAKDGKMPSFEESDITAANILQLEARLHIPGERRLPDDPEEVEEPKKNADKPVCAIADFKGAAYIAYNMGKKLEYLIIDKFEDLEPVFYP